jgi:hypothetical protein
MYTKACRRQCRPARLGSWTALPWVLAVAFWSSVPKEAKKTRDLRFFVFFS